MNDRLADELVERAERELAAAGALFERLGVDSVLAEELDRRLGGPVRPLLIALAAWDERPTEADGLLAVNGENTERLAGIVAEHGWPGRSLVGVDGADAAWLLAQHADLANDRRREWLPELREAIATGEADPRHYAYLVDRVAAAAGAPQTYGCVVLAESGRPVFPLAVADPDQLDERRCELGLPPLVDDLPVIVSGAIPYRRFRGESLRWPR